MNEKLKAVKMKSKPLNKKDTTMAGCPNPSKQNLNPMHDDCMCENKLDITKICAKCAKVCWLKAKEEWAEKITANDICAQVVDSVDVHANYVSTNDLCAVSANINSLCVTNLSAPNFSQCNTRRAYVGLNGLTTSALGTDIAWDNVYDDPSSMFSAGPSKFTVPVAGYYSVSLFLNLGTIAGAANLFGTPVATPSVYVNGVERKLTYIPLLAFANKVATLSTSHLLLAAGDVVTTRLNVLYLDPVLGEIPYVGTVDLIGGSISGPSSSTFDIFLLSNLCTSSGTQPTCTPCQPVTIACEPVVISGCEPCL